eukprot:2509351-Pyramimonas_sp.AAC.2
MLARPLALWRSTILSERGGWCAEGRLGVACTSREPPSLGNWRRDLSRSLKPQPLLVKTPPRSAPGCPGRPGAPPANRDPRSRQRPRESCCAAAHLA